jgi:hypothetical protein
VITITIPYPGDPSYDARHGMACWREPVSDAHYVREKAGINLRWLDGLESAQCADIVRTLIVIILDDPDRYAGPVSYYDFRTTVTSLTELFFTLRQRPDGIVHVK